MADIEPLDQDQHSAPEEVAPVEGPTMPPVEGVTADLPEENWFLTATDRELLQEAALNSARALEIAEGVENAVKEMGRRFDNLTILQKGKVVTGLLGGLRG